MFRRNFLQFVASCLPAAMFVRPSIAAELMNKNPSNLPVIKFNDEGKVSNWDELLKHAIQPDKEQAKDLAELFLNAGGVPVTLNYPVDLDYIQAKRWVLAFTEVAVMPIYQNRSVIGEILIDVSYPMDAVHLVWATKKSITVGALGQGVVCVADVNVREI